MIASVETLACVADAIPGGARELHTIIGRAKQIFVFGAQPNGRHSAILRELSRGQILAVERLRTESDFQITPSEPEWCREFSGLTFSGVKAGRDHCFSLAADASDVRVLVSAVGRPFLLSVANGQAQLCFSACEEIADLDERVSSHPRLLDWFSRVAPLLLFLRSALGNRVWHNSSPKACFIVDDPLLKRRYGFLNYQHLFDNTKGRKFSFCIAFIPWNYRRSRRAIADLFSAKDRTWFLCVHGCDHSGAEFGSEDIAFLTGRAHVALARMRAHRARFGTPFDDVMVFPQGIFTSKAIEALGISAYLAAVNTELSPKDTPGQLTLRDAMNVAIDKYGSAPLFGRSYPLDVAEFAFALLLGKPALLVEHHQYFRDGYQRLVSFVDALNLVEPCLEWATLGTICETACLTRDRRDHTDVWFFTKRFRFQNTQVGARDYVFLRRSTAGLESTVTVNGQPMHWEQEGGFLKFRLRLNEGQVASVDSSSTVAERAGLATRLSLGGSAKVLVRRVLSEYRDNYVNTSPVLNLVISRIRRVRPKAGFGS